MLKQRTILPILPILASLAIAVLVTNGASS